MLAELPKSGFYLVAGTGGQIQRLVSRARVHDLDANRHLALKADQQCPEPVTRRVPVAWRAIARIGVYYFAEQFLDGVADLLKPLPLLVQPGGPQ